MADSMVPTRGAELGSPGSALTVIRPDEPAADSEAFHRLTARLATLDLDPATLEILTAVLTADLDGERP